MNGAVESGERVAREVHDFATLLGFGADGVCPYMAYEALAAARGEGVDVIIDMVGAGAAAANLQAAALGARWVQVGRMAGSVAQIDLDLLSKKRLSLIALST